MSSKLSLLGAATALAFAFGTAAAQPAERDHRRPPPPPPPPAGAPAMVGPTSAPPAPQAENPGAKSGFVWIAGRWNWQADKWEWTPGHWERERAGKHWRAGRWEQRGNTWAWTEGAWDAGASVEVGVNVGVTVGGGALPPPPPPGPPGPAAPPGSGPTAPPPPPQAENAGAKAGFVWVAGHWDWKANKWEWINGHWERERAGKHWRQGEWRQQSGAWVYAEGTWGDEAGPPPGPPGPPPGPEVRDHRHEWRLDRPAVSNYWPASGAAGTRVAIHGTNLTSVQSVLFGSAEVVPVKHSDRSVVFVVPPGAASSDIFIKRDHGRPLPVGHFDVVAAAGPDPELEWRKQEEARRKAAEQAWAAQQAALAKDRAAREAAWHAKEAEWEANREARRAQHAAEIRAKWDAMFLGDADTQAELVMHGQRMADLERARQLVEVAGNAKLGVRIQVAMGHETDRHDQRMAALKASFAAKGGTP